MDLYKMKPLTLSWISLLEILITQLLKCQACHEVFIAQNMTQVFRGSCEEMTFPCDPTKEYRIFVGDCRKYYRCANLRVYECECGPDTAFDAASGQCIQPFYANCTCPNGVVPSTTTSTTTAPTTEVQQQTTEVPVEGPNVGGIVGGVIAALIGIGVVAVIIFFVMRKKENDKHLKKGDSYINKTYAKQGESIKSNESGTYASIDEKQVNPDLPSGRETLPNLNNGDISDDPVYDNKADKDPTDYDNSAFVDVNLE